MKTYKKLHQLLTKQDKYGCIKTASQAVSNNEMTIVELYEDVLTPFLLEVGLKVQNQEMTIWQEHVYSAIVQSIIECMYPQVYEAKGKPLKKSVMVVCPSEELHELGSRMVADFFVLLGYDVTYVGCNTPRQDIILGISQIKPDYVAISISNFFNLTYLDDIINDIKQVDSKIKVIVGGRVFTKNKQVVISSKADYLANSFQDLKNIKEEA